MENVGMTERNVEDRVEDRGIGIVENTMGGKEPALIVTPFSRCDTKVGSLVYIIIRIFLEALMMSFMKMLKRSGPITEPCGISHGIV